ncbi:hypothetical protein [Dyadobacter sp. CY323]|uniref:hypothetical protein n=1 Tax=Dyadobacter sp. CY323 TaxID=2907302 RepID=UPI001F1EE7E1|nr:hypothetical protein [Dyadobacter sp. CY323]MCE6989617.1 hypothetical protein [Dyadobacter sp. CY323]
MKKVNFLLVMFLLISMLSVQAGIKKPANELTGTWKYKVSNVPVEYETGFMTFEEKDGKTSGYLGQSQKSEMKALTVADGKVTFKLDFEGGILTVTMVQDGDKLNGSVVSQDGEFPITAVKEEKK